MDSTVGKDWLEARIQQIQAARPDLVVLASDIVEGEDPSESEFLSSLRTLRAPLGVWGVTGNHEFDEENESSPSVLEHNGVHVLHDRWEQARHLTVIFLVGPLRECEVTRTSVALAVVCSLQVASAPVAAAAPEGSARASSTSPSTL